MLISFCNPHCVLGSGLVKWTPFLFQILKEQLDPGTPVSVGKMGKDWGGDQETLVVSRALLLQLWDFVHVT